MKVGRMSLSLYLAIAVGLTGNAIGQCVNINAPETTVWVDGIISHSLGDDDACRISAPDRDGFASNSACNVFVSRIMVRQYGLNQFGAGGSFLKANEIAALLPTWDNWVDLGSAGDQNALDAASAAANLHVPVLAVWANPTPGRPGHVALIGPGPLTRSPRWGGLKTPVAAAFKLDDVEAAFLGQPLACAFGPTKKDATHLWKETARSTRSGDLKEHHVVARVLTRRVTAD